MRTLYFADVVSFFFFPRLFSAIGDCISTVRPHMMWPYCEFRMHVWNVLHAARWKYRTRKLRQKSLSVHYRTTLSGSIFASKTWVDNRKKNLLNSNISSTCSHNMVNGWDLLASLGYPSKFQRVSRLGFVITPTSRNGGRPNFARCLVVSWAATFFFLGGEALQNSLCISLAFSYIGSVTAWHSSTRRQPEYSVVQGMELRNFRSLTVFVVFNRGRHLYSEGGHHVGHTHSSCLFFWH